MEERVPADGGDPVDEPPLHPMPSPAHYDPIYRPRPFPSRKRSIKNPSLPLNIESETYVVQIPKEQVFSVPPPENAIIAERYRYHHPDKESSCCKRLLCAVITLIVLGIIIGAIIGIFHLVHKPKVPVFSVDQVNVKNPPSSSHKTTHLGYEITFKANNPNKRMRIAYSSDGDATLWYRNHKIGTGKFPGLDQEAGKSTNVRLILTRSNGALPSDIESSIQDKKGKQHVSLSLKMNVPIKMNAGSLKLWSKVIGVVCNFKVSSLGAAGKHVLSQQCQTKLE